MQAPAIARPAPGWLQRIGFDAVLVVVFAALMVPAAQAKVEAEPVPYTLQLLFVLLTGLLLGPWRGSAAMALYAVVGFAGAPIFARGGGPAYFLTPTAGYLYGFIAGAFVTGMVAQILVGRAVPLERGSRGAVTRFVRVNLIAALAGIPVIYVFGVVHLAAYYALASNKANPWGDAWAAGAGIFLWYDVIKASIAAAIVSSSSLQGASE